MRWFVFVFYLLVGPAYFLTQFTPRDGSYYLAAAAAVSGLLVGLVHLRRQTPRGRWGVAIGTVVGVLGGGMAWAMGALALAFAGDSGKGAALIEKLVIGWTFLVLVVAAPLGAMVVGSLVEAIGSKKK